MAQVAISIANRDRTAVVTGWCIGLEPRELGVAIVAAQTGLVEDSSRAFERFTIDNHLATIEACCRGNRLFRSGRFLGFRSFGLSLCRNRCDFGFGFRHGFTIGRLPQFAAQRTTAGSGTGRLAGRR